MENDIFQINFKILLVNISDFQNNKICLTCY